MSDDGEDEDDTTTDAIQQAADAMRAACQAAYHATYAPGAVYHRLGVLVELLAATSQIARMTGDVLDKTERMDLGTDDGSEPAAHIAAARHLLLNAAMQVGDAAASANDAWSEMSPILLRR